MKIIFQPMRFRCMRVCLLALLLAGGEAAVAAEANASAASDDTAKLGSGDPRDYLKFSNTLTADCMLHRSQLRRIANTDPERAIQVTLVNYTGKTRSQGQSVKILGPVSKPQPLGCDGSGGLERRWKILDAKFVDVSLVPPEDNKNEAEEPAARSYPSEY